MGFFDGAAGALVGGLTSAFGAHKANVESRESTSEQMKFQERMSNTSYQRAVEDMRKAGINPMLAFSQGGASSGPGSSYTAQNVLQGASSTAKDMMFRQGQLDNLKLSNYKLRAEVGESEARTQQAFSSARQARALADNAEALQPGLELQAAIDRSELGHVLKVTDNVANTSSKVLDNINPVKKLFDRPTPKRYYK